MRQIKKSRWFLTDMYIKDRRVFYTMYFSESVNVKFTKIELVNTDTYETRKFNDGIEFERFRRKHFINGVAKIGDQVYMQSFPIEMLDLENFITFDHKSAITSNQFSVVSLEGADCYRSKIDDKDSYQFTPAFNIYQLIYGMITGMNRRVVAGVSMGTRQIVIQTKSFIYVFNIRDEKVVNSCCNRAKANYTKMVLLCSE